MNITKYNYLTTIRLFLHYLFGNGEEVNVTIQDGATDKKWYAGYLAIGHYNPSNGYDVYDFNQNEWPNWLCNIGTPFIMQWKVD